MRNFVGLPVLVVSCLVTAGALSAQQGAPERPPAPAHMPAWAYPVATPAGGGGAAAQPAAAAPAPPADEKLTVPGSSASFTRAEIRDGFNVADWRPDLHGPMPEIVSNGRRSDVRGCAFCHYPNGQGRPENGPVAGLPAAYIIQQMADFKSGARMSSEPRMGPPNAMIALAKAATDEEVRISAEYFSSLRFRPWIRVVEAATVPKSTIVGGMFVPAPEGGTEPIGQRILEMPEDFARTEIRDPGTGFVAYVPPGSIAKGEALVTTGGGKTIACGVCHGETLRGLGPVPAIAGRSPSYLTRQMFDIQNGTRGGPWADLMDAVVADLTMDDMLAIAAYVSSRQP
jgi:cytochrome c553